MERAPRQARAPVLRRRRHQDRSHGGGDEDEDLAAICACHHLRGIHGGYVRVRGRAPDRLVWELGYAAGPKISPKKSRIAWKERRSDSGLKAFPVEGSFPAMGWVNECTVPE